MFAESSTKPPREEYKGIIDTGFTGFLQLPLHEGFAPGLPLEGTLTATLADGTSTGMLVAHAVVTFAGKTESGLVCLAPGTDAVLIGMDFLRHFRKCLMIVPSDEGIVFVYEQEPESD